ncbi:unnamed protein product [Lactuca virosa]|uniref:Secreted protein n=1 Tax=Lactuca virosa TaxID=75947 RepID=A0AAU9MSA5_9ASTR|nr:unnamed protein product [Lactuca virosa]
MGFLFLFYCIYILNLYFYVLIDDSYQYKYNISSLYSITNETTTARKLSVSGYVFSHLKSYKETNNNLHPVFHICRTECHIRLMDHTILS